MLLKAPLSSGLHGNGTYPYSCHNIVLVSLRLTREYLMGTKSSPVSRFVHAKCDFPDRGTSNFDTISSQLRGNLSV